MKLESLKMMKCPYCGSGFNHGEVYRENNGDIIDGFIVCECSNEYPILEGILNLKVGPLNKHIMKYMKRGKIKTAVELSMDNFGERFCEIDSFLRPKGIFGQALVGILSVLVKTRAKRKYNRYSDVNLSFCNMLGKGESEIYLKNRFSAETFWSLYPFVSLLKENRERVLDLSCGMGHSSFVLSTYVKPQELVCADYSFRHLYLAKKYFVKDAATLVCLDANYSLPFKDSIFSSILMLDAFHYIQGRSSLAREMERVISPQGFLLLPHLHNSLNYNLAAGQSLTPKGWYNLFQHVPVKLLPEKNVVEDFIRSNKLDLAKEYSEAELNSSNALVIIGVRNKLNLHIHQDVWENIFDNKSNLVINSIYTIERKVDSVILRRKFPSESFKKEYPLMEKYLPEECIINGMEAKAINGRTLDISSVELSKCDQHHIEELMRKFVVINTPQNYS